MERLETLQRIVDSFPHDDRVKIRIHLNKLQTDEKQLALFDLVCDYNQNELKKTTAFRTLFPTNPGRASSKTANQILEYIIQERVLFEIAEHTEAYNVRNLAMEHVFNRLHLTCMLIEDDLINLADTVLISLMPITSDYDLPLVRLVVVELLYNLTKTNRQKDISQFMVNEFWDMWDLIERSEIMPD